MMNNVARMPAEIFARVAFAGERLPIERRGAPTVYVVPEADVRRLEALDGRGCDAASVAGSAAESASDAAAAPEGAPAAEAARVAGATAGPAATASALDPLAALEARLARLGGGETAAATAGDARTEDLESRVARLLAGAAP